MSKHRKTNVILDAALLVALVASAALLGGCRITSAETGNGSSSGSTGNNGTPPTTFTVGGTIVGLTGTEMVLQDNGGDSLPITANGGFTFVTKVSGAYAVTIQTQPSNPVQSCTITNATGNATANVTNVLINCGTTGLTVGGSVSGLIGSGLVLQFNGASNYMVSGTGNVPFTFTVLVNPGSTYAVTIQTAPSNPAQTCSVVNGTGTANTDVTNVSIICGQPSFTISGAVVGLVESPGDTLEMQDNGGDDTFVTGDTTFTFPTQITYGGIYNAQTFLEPSSNQGLPCIDFGYTGVATSNVSSILVDCGHNDWAWDSWYLTATTKANNYAAVTTPLQPPNATFPQNLGTPGGRDFAAAWTDHQGRKWLFGGDGYPYISTLGPQEPGVLNDLWVYDDTLGTSSGWIPANLPIYVNGTGPTATAEVRLDPLIDAEENATTASAPGSRWGSSAWTSNSGNLYLFGGQGVDSGGNSGLLNDLWKCTPGLSIDVTGAGTSSCPWSLAGDSTTANTHGTYGTQGSPGGTPGGRWAAATTTDASGNFWLFGGQGVDSAGTTGLLNDLWEYNSTSNQWTWYGPSASNTANHDGSYGVLGTGTGTTFPGGRQAATMWADSSGNIWLFGGFGFDSVGTGSTSPTPAGAILNDLWMYNVTSKQWTWISGNKLANQTGTYGTEASNNLSTGAAANVPGSRWGAAGWVDIYNNLWFFGGWGYGATTTSPTGFLDDVWEYQHSSQTWIWWKGISNANQNTVFAIQAIPGGDNAPYVNNVVGGRRGAAIWAPGTFGTPSITIFGGEGFDSSQGGPPGYLDDLWDYILFPN